MPAEEGVVHHETEALYLTNHRWLHDWLTRRVGCAHRASDFAHDTFVKILARPSQNILGQPRALLAHIANHLVIDEIRRTRIELAWLESLKQLQPNQAPSPQEIAGFIDELERVAQRLQGLKEKPRRAFLMFRLDGLSQAEIANELGVTVSSVKKYISQALLHCIESSEN